MSTPSEIVQEERGRAEALTDTFLALFTTAADTLNADIVSQPVVDVEFGTIAEPTLEASTALRTSLEARLAGGTGLDSTVEAGIWDRGRERETATADAQLAEIALADEALGFDFPTGTMAARTDRATAERHAKVSGINRDIAIKQADLEQQNLKDAIAALVQLYQFLMTQDVEHWKALISQNEATKQYVLAAAKINADILNDNRNARLDAAKMQTQALAQLLSSAIGRVTVSAGIDGRSSTDVNYSYRGEFVEAAMGSISPLPSI